mmetsp:Transcript_14662/g.37466  ORF Transcript_14662/g.37466 Transcript_14662/m.37466 type:complete len:130 (+) Transcript_14662:1190-1579(+)
MTLINKRSSRHSSKGSVASPVDLEGLEDLVAVAVEEEEEGASRCTLGKEALADLVALVAFKEGTFRRFLLLLCVGVAKPFPSPAFNTRLLQALLLFLIASVHCASGSGRDGEGKSCRSDGLNHAHSLRY